MAVKIDNVSLINKVLTNSTSLSSPFTVSLSAGSASIPLVGKKYYAFIEQLDDSSKWANVIAEVTGALELTVSAVLLSSENDRSLPAFSSVVRIDSSVPTQRMNEGYDGGYDIVMACGQSNMVTGVDFSFDPFIHSGPEIYQRAMSGTYLNTVVPFQAGPAFAFTAKTDPGGIIPIVFSKEYSRSLGYSRRLMVIPAAYGGSSITEWIEGQPQYIAALNSVNQVLTDYPASKVVAFLWHNGETDATNSMSQATYEGHALDMTTSFRANIATSDAMSATDRAKIPFICGGLCPDWVDAGKSAIDAALANLPNIIEYSAYASSASLTGEVGDEIHFDVPSISVLGVRYWNQYGTAILNEFTPTAPGSFGVISGTPGPTNVALSWAAVTGYPAPAYTIERKEGAGSYSTVTTGLVTTSFNDDDGGSGLSQSTEYTYRVTATNGTLPDSVSAETPFTTTAASSAYASFRANVGVTADANGVSQWDDQSGNARHAVQSVNANKMTDGGAAGLASTNDTYMNIDDGNTFDSADTTRIVKFTYDGGTVPDLLVGTTDASASQNGAIFWVLGSGSVAAGSMIAGTVTPHATDPATLTPASTYTFAVTVTAGGGYEIFNVTSGTASSVATGTGSVPSAQQLTTGRFNSSGVNALDGDHIAIDIYDQILTSGEIETIVASYP